MDILERIVAVKKEEVRTRKKAVPLEKLIRSELFDHSVPSLYDALKAAGPSVIAEFKRKSPSKGVINSSALIEEITHGYIAAGAAAISILTDNYFFGGDNKDLTTVKLFSEIPLLRKDFIIDDYQVYESKSIGASAILLIGSVLNKTQTTRLASLAQSLGLDVLFEIHELGELEKLHHSIRIVGVNNRNLKTFEVNMEKSLVLLRELPQHCLKVAESGFETPSDVRKMFSGGYDAFLIGERFMRSEDPGKNASEFIAALK
jgi:indole-3-glycerol phosphate synthase